MLVMTEHWIWSCLYTIVTFFILWILLLFLFPSISSLTFAFTVLLPALRLSDIRLSLQNSFESVCFSTPPPPLVPQSWSNLLVVLTCYIIFHLPLRQYHRISLLHILLATFPFSLILCQLHIATITSPRSPELFWKPYRYQTGSIYVFYMQKVAFRKHLSFTSRILM